MPKEKMNVGDQDIVVGWHDQSVQLGVVKAGVETHEEETGFFGSLKPEQIDELIKVLRRAKRKAYA